MNLAQPLLSIVVTAALAMIFLVGKVVESMSAREETKPDGTIIKHEGVDLEFFNFVTGFGAFFSLIWMLQVLGVFGSAG